MNVLKAQKPEKPQNTVFGIQLSPIIPNNLLENNEVVVDHDTTVFQLGQKPGISFGMEIRSSFSNWLALQYGINLMKRNYTLDVEHNDSLINGNLGLLCYEIPVSGLVYARITKWLYMNAAFGISFSFYPSDVFIHEMLYAQRQSWVQPALKMNVGFEIRTENSGAFYLGASYDRMFFNLYKMYAQQPDGAIGEHIKFMEKGSYFSVNFKYFFPIIKD
ncbi:MAG: hypothetical protein C0594_15315 [Marinilabiliales bacterium]|nr:MAG: hypothetical protein C0594_15315 [Marinilabiliales bacterium]